MKTSPGSLAAAGPRLGAALILVLLSAQAWADSIADLVAEVDQRRIRDHIATLDYPRNTYGAMAIAVDYIVEEFESYGYTVTLQPVLGSENVIARLEGATSPEEVLVLGAHFDTVANTPGADDNSSGVAALLEIARVLADEPLARSVEFVAFTLEEPGTVGSHYYVLDAVADGMDVVGMFCFDMIGYTCPTPGCQYPVYDSAGCLDVEPSGVNVGNYILALVNTASQDLLTTFSAAAETYVPELIVVTAVVAGNGACDFFTRRSDHREFWDVGYPAIEFYDTYGSRNPYYHTPGDSLGILDMPFCWRVTQATLASMLMTDVTAAPDGAAGAALAGLDLYPNPFNPQASVRFQLTADGPIALRVYDPAGRLVRDLAGGDWPAGSHELLWDGRDDAGDPAASGVYLIRLDHAEGGVARKGILLR